ncbi:hypothetical protein AAC387_Pa12g1269 [Persea americana]
MDGELIREILSNKSGQFEQVKISPIVKFLITGLVTHEGKKWVNHKRIISPAFHLRRLKAVFARIGVGADQDLIKMVFDLL